LNFKKLEVIGFKSFADKLHVSFSQGITAIVGPNGCGKSNVADSIRWVLGEQSAKLLRGHSMQDVIFNGTEKRKSLSYAEVSLHFDNKERIFPIDYNEVVLSRKLYRSGESEYFLNNTLCRLKDIVNLLRDSGMGREGYSIIGQGRIESLLSAKPEDRRAIFEEAAGISKHKAQKRESESKLERTTDNITRLVDIRDEKAKYLEPLSKQAETARQYLEYREKLKDIEINIYLHQHEYADKAKQAVQNRLQKTLLALEQATKDYNEQNLEFESIISQIASIDTQQKTTNEQLLELMVEIEKKSSDLRVVREKQNNFEDTVNRLTKEKDRMCQEIEKIEEDIIIFGNLAIESADKLEQERNTLDQTSSEYIKLLEELKKYESETELGHKSLFATYDKLSDVKADVSRLRAERDGLTVKKKELEEDKADIVQDIATQNTQLVQQINLRDELNEHREGLLNLLNQYEREAKTHINQLAQLSNEQYKATQKSHELLAKLKLAQGIRESNEGFVYTVKKLLEDSASDKKIKELIKGVVGKVLSVPPQFELAIETALGAAIQNIIVQDEEAARQLIEYLRTKRYGRATFLPLSSIKPRSIDSSHLEKLNEDGVLGIASNIVGFDSGIGNAIKSLLGATVIVENIEVGIQLAKKTGYNFKIVSLQGDVLSVSGAITGGQKVHSKEISIFGYERECSLIEQEYEEIKKELGTLSQQKDELSIMHSNALSNVEKVQKDIVSVEIKLAQNNQKIDTLSQDIQKDEATLNTCTLELLNIHSRLVSLGKDINTVLELENSISGDKHIASQGIQKSQTEYANLTKKRDEYNTQIANFGVSIAKLELENDKYVQAIANLKSQRENINKDILKLTDDIQRFLELIEKCRQDIESIYNNIDGNRQIEHYRAKLDQLEGDKQTLVQKQVACDRQRTVLTEDIRKLSDSKVKEEMQLIKVDSDIELMGQRIFEEYNLSYQECTDFKRDIAIGSATQEQSKLKKAIAALGNINLDAIEESKKQFEEYNQQCMQIEDLEKAKTDLLNVIKKLNKDMSETFFREFEKIRINFISIFKELFNGGNADLVLQVNDSMTESELLEAGIDIVAQPPEKKLQSISLLSGGERALTAIAILFAILRLKPMPFCVLDEIEAALDDANAHRFAKYLHKFSKETQFIVITHRKPTMEMADSLYGVTMEEKGVSKIVSVKLSEAVKVAESGEHSGFENKDSA